METTIKNLLLQEFTQRQTRNSAYSLRAFARDLDLGVTSLSDVLAGKRNLSKTNLEKVMERLAVSPMEQDMILRSRVGDGPSKEAQEERTLVDEDTFRLIADWHYLAILNLAKIKDNQANPFWISERLGIKADDAEMAIERLLRLKLITVRRGKMERTSNPLTTSQNIPSAAIRKHHRQNLQLAEEALFNVPVEKREFISATMAVNVEKLPQAKEILLKTRKKIAALLEQGPVSEVYTMSFQLFPLSKPSTETTKKVKTKGETV